MGKERENNIKDIKMFLIVMLVEADYLAENEKQSVLNSKVKVNGQKIGRFVFYASQYYKAVSGQSFTEVGFYSTDYINEVYNMLQPDAKEYKAQLEQKKKTLELPSLDFDKTNIGKITKLLRKKVMQKMEELVNERKIMQGGVAQASKRTSDGNRVAVQKVPLYESYLKFLNNLNGVKCETDFDNVIDRTPFKVLSLLDLEESLLDFLVRKMMKMPVLVNEKSQEREKLLQLAAKLRDVAEFKEKNNILRLEAAREPEKEVEEPAVVEPKVKEKIEVLDAGATPDLHVTQSFDFKIKEVLEPKPQTKTSQTSLILDENKEKIAYVKARIAELNELGDARSILENSDLELWQILLGILTDIQENDDLEPMDDGTLIKVDKVSLYKNLLEALEPKEVVKPRKKRFKKKEKYQPKRLREPKRLKPKRKLKVKFFDEFYKIYEKYGYKAICFALAPTILLTAMMSGIFKKNEKVKDEPEIFYQYMVDEEPDFELGEPEILEVEPQYTTADYYLAYVEGNVYLVTRSFNALSRCYEFHNVSNGELVGEVLNTNMNEQEIALNASYDKEEALEALDFEGCGLGHRIVPEAVVSLMNYCDKDVLTQADLDLYSSNSDEMKKMFREKTTLNNLIYNENVNILGDANRKPQKFTFIYNNGIIEQHFGFRVSSNEVMKEYNYIYDILSGNFYDINCTIDDEISRVIVDDCNENERAIADFNKIDVDVYASQNVLVLEVGHSDSLEWSGYCEENYYLVYEEALEDDLLLFRDIYNPSAKVLISQDFHSITYEDPEKGIAINSVKNVQNDGTLLPIRDYFLKYSFSGLKDNYTFDDIDNLRQRFNSQRDIRRARENGILGQSSFINNTIYIDDVVVFDTTSESINYTHGTSDLPHYYFLKCTGFTEKDINDTHLVDYNYVDLFDEHGKATISYDFYIASYDYVNSEEAKFTTLIAESKELLKDNIYDSAAKSLRVFLRENGYQDLIKDVYTAEEFIRVYDTIMNKDLSLQLKAN